ncbi:MAG: DDE-type integrase/transposase/recombinase [Marinobacterium sp.]|nr:DDE-type integrase/transposase/recombinase [Marinobacterium sp.]
MKLNRAKDLIPAESVQRYEYDAPGGMLHMDIKKLPRFDRPGHRVTGNRAQNSKGARYECAHICIDDHSRWVYAEVPPDEKKETTTGFLQRALKAYEVIGVKA